MARDPKLLETLVKGAGVDTVEDALERCRGEGISVRFARKAAEPIETLFAKGLDPAANLWRRTGRHTER